MSEWRWTNTKVLEDWARSRSHFEISTVIRTLKAFETNPLLPGEPVESPLGRERRVIQTPVARIYFAPPQTGWNATQDCLFLLAIDNN